MSGPNWEAACKNEARNASKHQRDNIEAHEMIATLPLKVHDYIRDLENQITALEAEVEELKEYKWMYEDLAK